MAEWSAGYVADIEYEPGLFRQQAPAHLDLVCLLNGLEPPQAGEDFAWCELGCGQGVTANVIAAANPKATVHAVDFHPAHIARARATAKAAGLGNVTFHETSFEDLAAGAGPALPAFDYITLHGVYSWVGTETKRAIVRFLARALKPGGAAYITYNTLPGWSNQIPLQRLLLEYARTMPGRSDHAVLKALDFAEALSGTGAGAAGDAELFKRLRDPSTHPTYLAHEYLNGSWQPLLHADVARDLAAAKLSYAGSAHMFMNEPSLMLSAEQRALLDGIADPVLRESFADYCDVERHRCDVFVRGARPLPPALREARLRDFGLALIGPIGFPHTIDGKGTPLVLEERVYGPIIAALGRGAHRIGDLLDLPEVRVAGPPPARQLALALVGAGAALATRGLDAAPLESVLRFNRAQVAEALAAEAPVAWLASSVGGAGLHTDAAGAQLYRAILEGAPTDPPLLVDHLLGPLRVTDFMNDPAALQANAQRRAQLAQRLDRAARFEWPAWRRLGMI
ncbi:class I SAM-dependent methyltransferase [Azospirillum sp.]|uniref:class I SAM-dependent methyltransferase n=1 Tax=Azospirillum sp. TaxID=34012 RepID=UPI003D723984